MNTTQTKSMPIILIAMLLIAVATVVALPRLDDLPMTRHAQTSHVGQKVDALKMKKIITNGNCKDMKVYKCDYDDTFKVMCNLGPDLRGGLLIGATVHQVITGYSGRTDYWDGVLSRCSVEDDLPFALP